MMQNIIENFINLNVGQAIVLALFALAVTVRLTFIIAFKLRLLLLKERQYDGGKQFLSLLLPVRNEEETLKKSLPKILKNPSKQLEIVAVDDFSQDATFSVLGAFREKDKRVKITSINDETRYSEKIARNLALKAAKNDWVMLVPPSIDAEDSRWINRIEAIITEAKVVIVNYCNITPDGGFYHQLYRLEMLRQHILSCGFIINGLPFVYNEQNVTFNKKKYFSVGGFKGVMKEHFAHLELVINQFITKENAIARITQDTAISYDYVAEKKDFLELLIKNKRIEKYLSLKKRIFLKASLITQYAAVLFFVTSCVVAPKLWAIIVLLFLLPLISSGISLKLIIKSLGANNLFLSSLIYDVAYPYIKLFHKIKVKRSVKK